MIALILALAVAAEDVELPRTLGASPAPAAPKKTPQEPPVYRPLDGPKSVSKPAPADQWNSYAWAPIPGERNNVWHGLLNTPPFEEAAVMPANTWHARVAVEYASADWTADEGVAESKFHGAYLTETFSVDYNWTERFQVGVRLVMGQLGEGDDENIQVIDGPVQIVEDGDRSFGLGSAVARARLVFPTRSAGTFGVRAEVKIPLSDEEDFLSSQTVDLGLTALYSKRWEKISFHANLGVVVPTGDLGVFTENDEASPYLHGALGISFPIRPHFVMIGQLEFNSSAFGDIGPIDEPVASLTAGARYKLGGRMYLSASLGFGLTEASGGLGGSGGLDFVF
jgi:hypothetical protein